jgi:preprotein translocase subunit SecA
MEDDQPIEHGMLTNAIENAQRRVEGKNFDIRKRVLQYDDVMNQQREIIYSQRRQVLNGENLKDSFTKMVENTVNTLVDRFCGENLPDMWDWEGINAQARDLLPDMEKLSVSRKEMDTWSKEDLKETLLSSIAGAYEAKETEYGPDIMRELERIVLLRTVDEKWMDHIDAMDQLRYGIGMRAYGQRDPVVEYKFEGFEMFEEMIRSIQYDSVKRLLRMRINREQGTPKREKVAEPVSAGHGGGPRQPVVRSGAKVGRNDPCPCGSGKKYKKCCGAG